MMYPSCRPQFSSSTFIIGAAQLVVHEAFEIMVSSGVRMESLIPITTVLMSFDLGGAESITFFAPAVRCKVADVLSRKRPVDSITVSMPNDFQGRLAGFFSARMAIRFPFIIIAPSSDLISALKIP